MDPFALVESKIIAAGSLNRFLKGKSYNRCRRGHILLSTALHGLHFQRFLHDNAIDDLTLNELKEWACSSSDKIPENCL